MFLISKMTKQHNLNNHKHLRIKYFIAFISSILIGLLSRAKWIQLPSWLHDYLGDVIWGGMVFFLFSTFISGKSKTWRFTVALAFSFAIEFSQLIKSDWFDAVRNLPGMRLVFGYGFLVSDLFCYTTGILIALLIDWRLIERFK